ncbi:MAG: SDR family oxidoreductase [Rhodobacterales bacterium]
MTSILITGGAGMVGRALTETLPTNDLVMTDLARGTLPDAVRFRRMDVTGADPETVIAEERPDVVVHLASIVTPLPGMSREQARQVDVTGTANVLAACIKHGVRRLVVTSSGAAYGYHADNPVPLTEDAPCRGNPAFAYADHKRQVEEMLARARQDHPELEQVILRVGTVLGAGVDNQITALFRRKRLLAIHGSDSPFVFIWTRDLARIAARAATDGPAGIFNVAGDGWLSVDALAQALGKPVLRVPAWALKAALAVAYPLRLSRYGPEQVRFLQYRPVLSNERLKQVFGYTPELTSAEVFDLWRREAGL